MDCRPNQPSTTDFAVSAETLSKVGRADANDASQNEPSRQPSESQNQDQSVDPDITSSNLNSNSGSSTLHAASSHTASSHADNATGDNINTRGLPTSYSSATLETRASQGVSSRVSSGMSNNSSSHGGRLKSLKREIMMSHDQFNAHCSETQNCNRNFKLKL